MMDRMKTLTRRLPLLALAALGACANVNPAGSMYAAEAASAHEASESGSERGNYSRLTVAFLPSKKTMDAIYNRPSGQNSMFYQPEIWLTNLQTSLGNYFKGVIKVKSLDDARSLGADLIAVVDVEGSLTLMTSDLTLKLGAAFSTPGGAEVASVSAENVKHANLFYSNPGASAQDAQVQFNKALLYNSKLVAFAQNARRAAPAAQAQATAPVAERAEPASDIDSPSYRLSPRPEDYALIVGVGKYSALPEAQYAERDAEAVKKHLLALGLPPRNIVSLSGGKATRGALQGYVEEWLPKNVKPGGSVFFYYSGHGAPDPKTGQAYLVPWDGDAAFLQSTAYPLKQLYASLGKLKAKSVIVALDSCFSGAGGRSVLAQGARPLVAQVEEGVGGESRLTVFAAASSDEITGTLAEQGHGAFTYYFLKGLGGGARDKSGAVTVQSLFDYLRPNVQDEAHRQNREQTPKLLGGRTAEVLATFK